MNGKGSKRRKENGKAVSDNWDKINWNKKEKNERIKNYSGISGGR